jgi:hypothetical protein
MDITSHKPHKTWDTVDREHACLQYAITGNMLKTSKLTNIPRSTLKDWQGEAWWVELTDKIRHETTDKHISRYTGLIDGLLDRVEEDMPNMRGKDAGVLSAVFTDKSQLLMNRPTSISGKDSSMHDLAAQFRAITDQIKGKQVVVIDQVIQGDKD